MNAGVPNPGLLIVGASARAAAASAIRAGFSPWCADLFADSDLRGMVPDAVRCPAEQYPSGLAKLLRNAPDAPWIYTGGLENHPRLIEQMARIRRLWGNGPEQLRASRDPFLIQDALQEAGLPALRVVAGTGRLPSDCRWLRKPLRGSAGQGIDFANPSRDRRSRSHYYQQFIDGIPMSAVFVRAGTSVTLVGVTEQLIGLDWLNAPAFRYCGSVGPVDVTPVMRNELTRAGEVLGGRFGLVGVYGIDFIAHGGRPRVVEVNPRYPASTEVLELATGIAVLVLHRNAFEAGSQVVTEPRPSVGAIGKAIVYAPRRVVVPQFSRGSATLADVPSAGDVIEPGWPILTVLAAADSRDACIQTLMQASREVLDFLIGSVPPAGRDLNRQEGGCGKSWRSWRP